MKSNFSRVCYEFRTKRSHHFRHFERLERILENLETWWCFKMSHVFGTAFLSNCDTVTSNRICTLIMSVVSNKSIFVILFLELKLYQQISNFPNELINFLDSAVVINYCSVHHVQPTQPRLMKEGSLLKPSILYNIYRAVYLLTELGDYIMDRSVCIFTKRQTILQIG